MTVAILPMKPPAEGKSRLSPDLEPSFRMDLSIAMFTDAVAAVSDATAVTGLVVVTSDPRCAAIAQGAGAEVLDDSGTSSHSEAAARGVKAAAESGAGTVALVPGDCPAISPADLELLVGVAAGRERFLVVPDRHGTGTNALLISPPGAVDPSFGPDSCERHLAAGRAAGLHTEVVELESLAHDVDSIDDLDALGDLLARNPGVAPRTRELLRLRSEGAAGA